jgi:hypothetical protein
VRHSAKPPGRLAALHTTPGRLRTAAATKALLAYQVYERDDRQLRALAKVNLDKAIAYDVGTAQGQSDWAFNN